MTDLSVQFKKCLAKNMINLTFKYVLKEEEFLLGGGSVELAYWTIKRVTSILVQ